MASSLTALERARSEAKRLVQRMRVLGGLINECNESSSDALSRAAGGVKSDAHGGPASRLEAVIGGAATHQAPSVQPTIPPDVDAAFAIALETEEMLASLRVEHVSSSAARRSLSSLERKMKSLANRLSTRSKNKSKGQLLKMLRSGACKSLFSTFVEDMAKGVADLNSHLDGSATSASDGTVTVLLPSNAKEFWIAASGGVASTHWSTFRARYESTYPGHWCLEHAVTRCPCCCSGEDVSPNSLAAAFGVTRPSAIVTAELFAQMVEAYGFPFSPGPQPESQLESVLLVKGTYQPASAHGHMDDPPPSASKEPERPQPTSQPPEEVAPSYPLTPPPPLSEAAVPRHAGPVRHSDVPPYAVAGLGSGASRGSTVPGAHGQGEGQRSQGDRDSESEVENVAVRPEIPGESVGMHADVYGHAQAPYDERAGFRGRGGFRGRFAGRARGMGWGGGRGTGGKLWPTGHPSPEHATEPSMEFAPGAPIDASTDFAPSSQPQPAPPERASRYHIIEDTSASSSSPAATGMQEPRSHPSYPALSTDVGMPHSQPPFLPVGSGVPHQQEQYAGHPVPMLDQRGQQPQQQPHPVLGGGIPNQGQQFRDAEQESQHVDVLLEQHRQHELLLQHRHQEELRLQEELERAQRIEREHRERLIQQQQQQQEALLLQQRHHEAMVQQQREREALLQQERQREALAQQQRQAELLQQQRQQELLLQQQRQQEMLLLQQRQQEMLRQQQQYQQQYSPHGTQVGPPAHSHMGSGVVVAPPHSGHQQFPHSGIQMSIGGSSAFAHGEQLVRWDELCSACLHGRVAVIERYFAQATCARGPELDRPSHCTLSLTPSRVESSLAQSNTLPQLSPLALACRGNATRAVELVLRHGANPNYIDESGWPPLFHACTRALDGNGTVADANSPINADILTALVGNGAQINRVIHGVSPVLLVLAHDAKHRAQCNAPGTTLPKAAQVLAWLFHLGADPSLVVDGVPLLYRAIESASPGCIQLFINAGVNLEMEALDSTPLVQAIGGGRIAVVECLLRGSCDPNHVCGPSRQPPLVVATVMGHAGVARVLVSHGANVNLPDRNGQTAIMHAAATQQYELMTFLSQAGGLAPSNLQQGAVHPPAAAAAAPAPAGPPQHQATQPRQEGALVERPYWIPDQNQTQCTSCDAELKGGGRHHCRMCGGLFCVKCCGTMVPLPTLKYRVAQRVCVFCVDKQEPAPRPKTLISGWMYAVPRLLKSKRFFVLVPGGLLYLDSPEGHQPQQWIDLKDARVDLGSGNRWAVTSKAGQVMTIISNTAEERSRWIDMVRQQT